MLSAFVFIATAALKLSRKEQGSVLTDIFARRYQDVPLWENFDESARRRLLVQGFRIVSEQLFPYYEKGKVRPGALELWDGLNKKLAMELGLKDLSARTYPYTDTYQGKPLSVAATCPTVTVCENFVCADYDGSVPADRFVKERLSFVEIAFRRREEEIADLNAPPSQDETMQAIMELRPIFGSDVKETTRSFRESCDELNERFRQAGAKLDYHNGIIQISPDELTTDQIERPFWNLVSAPEWENVDHDMKEAIDRRNSTGRDPAFYAARALESAIKIISEEKRWTSGKEMGAKNYLDNLQSHEYINAWEYESLTSFFSKVRNPLSHGPGSSPKAELTLPQTDWAIEFCMSWIKNLIRRM